MDITVAITQEAHDCVLSQLVKNEDGTDALTVQNWLQGAIDGKVYNCQKRANPVAVLEGEKAALEARVAELEATQSI